ncbi:hypothetical protein LZ198_32935 [Myxococcus sp. K15C18031901]|uniref:hypothetical protein n=1 Tax=Myxococcus dinghuensis TaxID=2906761 RepID=UPI0020A82863|nr:hypothetical protein [Myxococcus dinghuensis]MCP3103699.1 hypothetical protein [Myxococcus dinghuensis]
MSDLNALRLEVATHAGEDGPRRAYAEALRGVDDARAEFIQVQLDLRGRMDPARRRALQRRERELLVANAHAWLQPLQRAQVREPTLRRGFVDEMSLPEDALAKHGSDLFAREPVYRLEVRTRNGQGLATAVTQPWFSQVRWLRVEGDGVDAATRALASAPHARHLDALVLTGATDAAVDALTRATALTALRSVSLSSCQLTGEGMETLAKATLPWTRLYLSGSGLTDEDVATLAGAKGLGALTLLALNRSDLGDEAAEALAKSRGLGALERLELSRNELSEEGALAFRSVKALPRLRRLELLEMGLDFSELGPLQKRLGDGLRL